MRDIVSEVQRWREEGESRIFLATVIRTFASAPRGPGAAMAIRGDGRIAGSVSGGCVEAAVIEEALRPSRAAVPRILRFQASDESAWAVGLSCGGTIDVLLETLDSHDFDFLRDRILLNRRVTTVTIIRGHSELLWKKLMWSGSEEPRGTVPSTMVQRLMTAAGGAPDARTVDLGDGTEAFVHTLPPAPTLVMVGGVHIATVLAPLARMIGYRTIVIDPRKTFGTDERFPVVDRLVAAWPEEAFAEIGVTPETAVAVLTHDPKFDDPALAGALRSPAFYVGALGSARSQEKRRARLARLGFAEAELARIRGPIGLDIGASSPEEIALAILAEVVAVRRGAAVAHR